MSTLYGTCCAGRGFKQHIRSRIHVIFGGSVFIDQKAVNDDRCDYYE